MRRRLRGAVIAATLILSVPPGPGRAFAQDPPRPRPQPPRVWTQVTPRPLAFGFMLEEGPPLTVKNVVQGSPVARAGIQRGDEIVSVDGRSATVDAIRDAGRRASAGDTIRFRIRRDGREQTIGVVPNVGATVAGRARDHYRGRIVTIDPDSVRALARLYLDEAKKSIELHVDPKVHVELDDDAVNLYRFHMDSLGEKIEEGLRGLGPAMESWARQFDYRDGEIDIDLPYVALDIETRGSIRGARLSDLEPDLASYFPGAEGGALVLSVRSGSAAETSGLRAGDVIVGVDGEPVGDLRELRDRLRQGDGSHQLTVVRRGERTTLTYSR